jgi:DNA-binding transcriptional MerR regulator
MAGQKKTRARHEAEAKALGITYEEYKERLMEEKRAKMEEKEAARQLRDQVKMKRSELSDWVVRFVKDNMRKHGQSIFESLLEDDPKAAANFLTQLMKFAAPTVADPDKLEQSKKDKGGDEKPVPPEYEEAKRKIDQLKKKFSKEE